MDAKEYNCLRFLSWCLLPDEERKAESIADVVGKIDWEELKAFGEKQAVLGIMAHTLVSDSEKLMTLDEFRNNLPTEMMIMELATTDQMMARRNVTTNKYCVKATQFFLNDFDKKSYRTCILKGQGNTLLYPYALSRTTGDIDIWVDGPRWDVFRLVRKRFPKAEFKCQHIEFPLWKNMPVEVHFYPMYLECPWHNIVLHRFFKKQREKQFNHKVSLQGATGEVAIPTPFFNAVYQLTHINVHVLIEGIGLRQFIDYYYVLRNLDKERHTEVCRWLKRMGLMHLAQAVMYIEHNVLGLPQEYLYTKPDERRGKRLMREVEIGGNFGKSDTRMGHIGEGFVHRQIRKLIRNSRFISDYPSEELSEPFFRIGHWLWRQWYQAKWLFWRKYHNQ